MLPRSLRHRAPLLWIVVPLIAGLVVGKLLPATVPPSWLIGASFLGLVAAAIWRRRSIVWASGLGVGVFLSGVAYYELSRARIDAWEHLPPREAQLTLAVERVFRSSDERRVNGLARIVTAAAPLGELAGQHVSFSLRRTLTQEIPLRSEEVKAFGVLQPLARDVKPDSFDAYLANAGVNFIFSRGRILATVKPAALYREFCERGAKKLSTQLGLGVERKRPELTAIYRAMMLGQKQDLRPDQDMLFMRSGTMHLFAINGLHIGVVALALHVLLSLLRCPRILIGALTLAILWLDVDTTGATPSAVRAFILVASCEAVFVLRIPGNTIAALALSALIVLVLHPMTLFSASFQMSYGVVLMILCFGLPLGERLTLKWQPFRALPEVTWNRWQHFITRALAWLAGAMGIGLSASLVSAITGVEFFHLFTPAALLANLVLVPLASLVIISGFVSLATGLLGATALTVLFNHAAIMVLALIEALIRAGLRVPHLWWATHWRADWIGPVGLGLLLGSCLAGYAGGWKPERGGFWPPFVIVALTLAFGVTFG